VGAIRGTPPTDRDPQRAQSRSRRANRADRKRKCHRIPNSFIRHESDLTRFLATRGSKLLKPEVRERFFDAENEQYGRILTMMIG
jgi:hypothetical protein